MIGRERRHGITWRPRFATLGAHDRPTHRPPSRLGSGPHLVGRVMGTARRKPTVEDRSVAAGIGSAAGLESGVVRKRTEEREETLSPYAIRSRDSRGREVAEEPSPLRTAFQRDRDRIIHSKAFRRLKHKTQVFIAPLGDHFVTRMTHTFEVAQIGRTIARALNLNEDLIEAMALAHDVGHTPFGHVGEDALNGLVDGGFRHSVQSVRTMERLEKEGAGLNLTWEVLQGIRHHSKPRGDFLEGDVDEDLTLEAQICRVSDAIAYLNHDLADAFRTGLLDQADLPGEAVEVLGDRHSQRINTMVTDVVRSSWSCTGDPAYVSGEKPRINMSRDVKRAVISLREFMFELVYLPESDGPEGNAAREIVRLLYGHFDSHRDQIPPEYAIRSDTETLAVADYISGMTDRYALRMADEIRPGIARKFRARLL